MVSTRSFHRKNLLPHELKEVSKQALLALLARSAALIRSLARPITRTRDHGKEVFVHDFNASISCSFNPLWAARLCMRVRVFRYPLSLRLR